MEDQYNTTVYVDDVRPAAATVREDVKAGEDVRP
jgi:hypothetical protein